MGFSPLTKPYDGFSQAGWVIRSTHVFILLVSCCCFHAAGAPVSVQGTLDILPGVARRSHAFPLRGGTVTCEEGPGRRLIILCA